MKPELIALGNLLTDIRNGLDAEQHDRQLSPDMLPISRIETISNGEIDFSRTKYVKITDAQRARYKLQCGDILFSHINSPEQIGKTAIYHDNRILIHGINLLLMRVDQEQCNPKYLNYYLNTFDVRARFRARCKKAVNQASLNHGDITSLEVPLPPLPDQQRIAAILDKADRMCRLRRYALELSETYLQAVFLQMFGATLQKPSKIQLGDWVTITGGGTPSREVLRYYEGNIPWLTAKDMRGEYISDTQEHITEEAIENSATKLVPAGSVLVVVKSKVLMHRLPLAITTRPMCHGQDIKSIPCSAKTVPEFVFHLLKYNEPKLLAQARGANTEGLTLPMLQEIKVPEDASLALQQKFARIMRQHERLRAQQREALRQAEQLFQTLLHRAFRGEV